MGELTFPAEEFSLADDFAERRPLPAGRVYHFNVIYNHARCPLSATQDNVKALQWTRQAVERLQLQGLVNTYYHDRDCPKGLSFRQELDRVLEGSEVTVLLLTPGFLQECWPRYWLLSSFRSLFTPGSDGTSATPAPPQPRPPSYTSSYLLPAVEDLTNYVLDSPSNFLREAEVLNRPVSSVVFEAEYDSSSEESAVQLSTSLFASAYYPSNCLEDVAYSSTPFLSSDHYHSSNKDSASFLNSSRSFSVPTYKVSSKTAVDKILKSSQICKNRQGGCRDGDKGGRVVVVVGLGVAKGEVPAVVKEGREVLFFGDGGEQDCLAWSRLEGWLLAAMPPPPAAAPSFASPVLQRKTPERRHPPKKTSEYSQLMTDLATTEQDLKYGQRWKEHSRTKTYTIPSRHYTLHNDTHSPQAPVTDQSLSRHHGRSAQRTRLSHDDITAPSSVSYGQSSSGHRGRSTQRTRRSYVDITNPTSVSHHLSPSGYGRSTQRTRPACGDMTYPRSVSHPIHRPSRHHYSRLLPLSSTLTASSFLLPKRSQHWVPAEREESPFRKGKSSSNASHGQPVQEGDRQKDHESGVMGPELSSPCVSVSSVEKSRHQHRTDQTARSHDQNGQQQNIGAADRWYDIQEIPSKLPRDEASLSVAKGHNLNTLLTSTCEGMKEENRANSSASNMGRIRKSESHSDRSPQNDFLSTALDHLEESGIKQEVTKGIPRSTGKSRSSAFSVVQTSVSRKQKNDRSHEDSTVLPRKQNTLIISSEKAELAYPKSQFPRESVDRQPNYEENDNMVKTGSPSTHEQTDSFEQVLVTKVMTAATETSAQTSDKHLQGHGELSSFPFSPKTSVPFATNLHLESGCEHSREHRTVLSTGLNHYNGQMYSTGTLGSTNEEKKTDIRSCHGNDHDSKHFWHCTSTLPASEKSSNLRDDPDISVLLDYQTDVDVPAAENADTAGDGVVGSITGHCCTADYASGDKEQGHDNSVMIKSTEPRYVEAMITECGVTDSRSKYVTCESPSLTSSQEHSLMSQKGELQCVTGDSSNSGRFHLETTDSHIPESPSPNQNMDSIVDDDHQMAERSGSFMTAAETDTTSLPKLTTTADSYETDRNNGLAGVMLSPESGSRKPSERSPENGKETQVHGKGIKTGVPEDQAGTQRAEQDNKNQHTEQNDTQTCLIQSEKQLVENKPETEPLRIQTEAETSSHELECQLTEHRTEMISSEKSSEVQALKTETDEIFQDRSNSEPEWYQHEFEIYRKEGQKETQQQKVPPDKTEIKTSCGEAGIQVQWPGSEDEISPQENSGLTSLFNNTIKTQPFENPFAKQPHGTLAETLSVETPDAAISPHHISDKTLPSENSTQTPPSGNPVETLPYQTSTRTLQHESSPETQTHEDLTDVLACDRLSYASLHGVLDETLSSENVLTRELFMHNPEEIPTLEDMRKATPYTMLVEPIPPRENATEETSHEQMVVAAPQEKSVEANPLEKLVKATSHAVMAETPPHEDMAETLPEEEMAETTPHEKTEETTLQEEMTETTPQEKMEETTPQKETAETTPQKEMTETTPQKEMEETMPQKEMTETTPQEKMAETTPQKEMTETTPQKEMEETTPQKEMEETTPQEKTETTPQKEMEETTPQEKTETTPQEEMAETTPQEKTETTPHRNLATVPPNDIPTETDAYTILVETLPHETKGEILSNINLPSTMPTPNTNEVPVNPLPCEHQEETQPGDSQAAMAPQKSAKQTALSDETPPCQNPLETMSHENLVEALSYGTPVQTLPSESLSESRLYQGECDTHRPKNQIEMETILPNETELVKTQSETQMSANQIEERFIEYQAEESQIISSASEVCTSTPGITYHTTGIENSTVKTDTGTVPPPPPPSTTAAQTDTKPKNNQHTIFTVDDDPSFSDFLSSSFVTSDDGALSLSADWSGAGNDSGFLSGGLLSFGETSPRVSTPRTRSQDTHHHTDGETVIGHQVSDSDTSKVSGEAEETMIAEEQHHDLLSAHASLDLQRRVTDRTFNREEHFSSEGFAVMEGTPHTKTIHSGRVSSGQLQSSTESLRLVPPGPRHPVSGRRMVHFRTEGVSVSSPLDVEHVSSSMQMGSNEPREGFGHSEVTGRVAAAAAAGCVSQAEDAAAVTRPDDPSASEETKPAEERTIARRVLPALVRMICHAISRPENPFF